MFSSSYIMFIDWIAVSIPAYCPAKTCSVPVHLMTSSFRIETLTLPAFLRKTTPTPIGRIPGFLSNGIKRQDRKAYIVWVSTRSVHNFRTTFANTLRRSLADVSKLLEARILRQPSASITDGLEPPLVLIAAFLIIYSFINWNLTGWIFCQGPFNKISCEAVLPFGCFLINLESVSLFSGNIPFSILLVNNCNADLMLPFAIYCLNFFNISATDDEFRMTFRDT